MSKIDFKKKVCKNENHFFFHIFFLAFIRIFLTINDQLTFYKNVVETIRKNVKNRIFFGFFGIFLDFFGTDWITFG